MYKNPKRKHRHNTVQHKVQPYFFNVLCCEIITRVLKDHFFFFLLFFELLFIYVLSCVACGTLASRPGIKPEPLAVELWSLNHWTARDVLED